jgi:hypothetical protein
MRLYCGPLIFSLEEKLPFVAKTYVQLPNFTGKQAVIVAPRWYQANSPTGPQRSVVMRRIRLDLEEP